MRRTRVIPCLLLKNRGFYKTKRFRDPVYLGDPINILRIFNDKEVDEIAVLDIGATPAGKPPQFDYIAEFASECFMPLAYGGGLSTIEEVRRVLKIGAEKCIINTCAYTKPELIKQAAAEFGSQSVVVAIDVKKTLLRRYETYSHGGTRKTGMNAVDAAIRAHKLGAGEILLTSIDRDGTMEGYDTDLIQAVSHAVPIPVIACGGAGSTNDLRDAARAGAGAVGAGAFFVFTGPHRAVLITVPAAPELNRMLP